MNLIQLQKLFKAQGIPLVLNSESRIQSTEKLIDQINAQEAELLFCDGMAILFKQVVIVDMRYPLNNTLHHQLMECPRNGVISRANLLQKRIRRNEPPMKAAQRCLNAKLRFQHRFFFQPISKTSNEEPLYPASYPCHLQFLQKFHFETVCPKELYRTEYRRKNGRLFWKPTPALF
ncbi:MAG: hypothetical protein M3Q80_01235 [bacterium]|nr:hypothetical protein [bacterium]